MQRSSMVAAKPLPPVSACLSLYKADFLSINEEYTTEYFLENVLVTNFRLKNLQCYYNIRFSWNSVWKCFIQHYQESMGFVKIDSVTVILCTGM